MLKINNNVKAAKIMEMHEMLPLQVARIVEKDLKSTYHIVMRTASVRKFEVIDLTEPGPNECWIGEPTIQVELLPPDEPCTINLYNEE